MRLIVFPAFFVIILFCAGCVNGPARYKSLGFFKYATVEMPKRVNPSNAFLKYAGKGSAGLAGIPIDCAVLITDTIMTPIVATNLTGFLPPETKSDPRLNRLIYFPFLGYAYASYENPGFLATFPYALFFYPSYLVGLQICDRYDYELFFGRPTGIFDKDSE